jgi:hypothetical protein
MIGHGFVWHGVVWYLGFFQEIAKYGDNYAALVIAGTAQLNAQLIMDGSPASDDKPYGG